MNYAVVILAAILLFSGVWWVISGRRHYVGPISETQVIDGLQTEKEKANSSDGAASGSDYR